MSCSYSSSKRFSSHHSDTHLIWFHLSKESDSRTLEALLNQVWSGPPSSWNVTSGLHVVVTPPHLHSGRRLLIVDFGNDKSTFSCALLTWLHIVKEFLFTKQRILWSFTLVCLTWSSRHFDVIDLTSAFFLFQECTKLLIWPLLTYFCYPFNRFILVFLASFTGIEIYLDVIVLALVKQLPNANSTPEINSRPFICFFCLEVEHERATPGVAHVSQVSKYFWAPEN